MNLNNKFKEEFDAGFQMALETVNYERNLIAYKMYLREHEDGETLNEFKDRMRDEINKATFKNLL